MIPRLPADACADEMAAALGDAGALVVTDVCTPQTRAEIRSDLSQHMERAPVDADDPEAFYPGATRRITGLLSRSDAVSQRLICHPTTLAMCDHFLVPNGELGYQVHVTAALEVGPGARAQILHREEDSFTYFPLPRPNIIVASMWAISDFRADNGATLIVPGSHRWDGKRQAQQHEIVPAEMPAGSVLFWMGGTLHGAGANTSGDWRYGVILTYSLGWVRQEENQYLNVPAERVAQLPQDVRKLAGFTMYGALGLYDPTTRSPR